MMLHPLPLLKGMNHRVIDIHLVMVHHHLNHLSFLPLGLHYRLGLRLLLPLLLGIWVWLLPYLGSSGNYPVIGLLTVRIRISPRTTHFSLISQQLNLLSDSMTS
jgi:hypothetical protein